MVEIRLKSKKTLDNIYGVWYNAPVVRLDALTMISGCHIVYVEYAGMAELVDALDSGNATSV